MTEPTDIDGAADEPISELRDFAVEPDPDLQGRVRRDINRRTLAANGLEFSLNVMLGTFWEYLQSLVDAWPGRKPEDKDDGNE